MFLPIINKIHSYFSKKTCSKCLREFRGEKGWKIQYDQDKEFYLCIVCMEYKENVVEFCNIFLNEKTKTNENEGYMEIESALLSFLGKLEMFLFSEKFKKLIKEPLKNTELHRIKQLLDEVSFKIERL